MNTIDEPMDVVAAVVSRGGKFLVGQRPPSKHHGGCWEFPGGKIRPGETPSDAIKRELAEELGVSIIKVGTTIALLSDAEIQIRFLHVGISEEPITLEHSELRWCDLRELESIDLAPIDNRFVQELKNHGFA